MSYHLHPQETLSEGVRRIAREQLDQVVADIRNDQRDAYQTTHEIRKCCKKMRGLVRFVRSEDKDLYKKENKFFHNISRQFSELRDADVMTDSYDLLMERFDEEVDRRAMGPVRQALTKRRNEIADGLADTLDEKFNEVAEAFEQAKQRVDIWPDVDIDDVEDAVNRTYKRGVAAMEEVEDDPSGKNLHSLRKRAKYHRYHARLLEHTWDRPMKARRKEVKELTRLLGEHHDLTVFARLIQDERSDAIKHDDQRVVLTALIQRHQETLREQAIELGRCVFADKPKALTHRWGEYWRVSHAAAA